MDNRWHTDKNPDSSKSSSKNDPSSEKLDPAELVFEEVELPDQTKQVQDSLPESEPAPADREKSAEEKFEDEVRARIKENLLEMSALLPFEDLHGGAGRITTERLIFHAQEPTKSVLRVYLEGKGHSTFTVAKGDKFSALDEHWYVLRISEGSEAHPWVAWLRRQGTTPWGD